MMFELSPIHIIYYAFAFIAVVSGAIVVTARDPVRSVLSLVLTFFAMAGIWMLLRAEFLSLILILVYVGAVMTLFLFVVMMLNIDKEKKHKGLVKYLPIGILIVVGLTALIIIALKSPYLNIPNPPKESVNYSNTQQLGAILYTDFAYPFEIAGVLLLAAMIAAITLAHRKPRRKVQFVDVQVAVQPDERVRLIKMKPEGSTE